MKIKFLGTSAAEGIPALFCYCDICKKSAAAGGRNIRTRSQAIIDDKILIDFPMDTYMHVLHQGLNLKEVNSCIVTHSHEDHLYPHDILMRRDVFAYAESEDGQKPMTFYATKKSGEGIDDIIKKHNLEENANAHFQRIKPFEPFDVEGYKATAYKADHAQDLDPVIYSLSDGEKTFLYANDTGYFPDETWEYMAKEKPYFNFVSLDCTGCVHNYRRGHMGVDTCGEVKERLLEIGCADDKTVWCYHHFSHNGLVTYDEFVPIAKEKGFLVSYDGMEYNF
ncbi:MAG: MBL fold metallo-hydrolase [Eubacteriales bacterium]